MKERTILHCDLNNFFASVSLLSNPTLYDLPVAVCGSKEDRHGIVLAKNEIAKKAGVKTAEAIWEAQSKCPDLVILKPDYPKYKEFSNKAKEIYARYTDLIEPFGIDECWLDVTGSRLLFGDGETIANRIRREIKAELGITISVGVSFNKIFAKLGSDMKKPDAVTVISKENFKEKIWDLPASDLLFVGKNTTAALNRVGIFTIGDLARCNENVLKKLLGVTGPQLKIYASGEDTSPVLPISYKWIPKSVGRTVTPKKDLTENGEVWKIFLELAESISAELRKNELYATGVCVHTRNNALKTKETTRSFKGGTNCAITLAKKAFELFEETYDFKIPLRSVGFRAVNLKEKENIAYQQDLFGETDKSNKEEEVENTLYSVKEKFGRLSIKRGTTVEK